MSNNVNAGHSKKMAKKKVATPQMSETLHQWPFQDPKMEVPTIYKA